MPRIDLSSRAREPGLDGGEAGQVEQAAGVVCGGGRGEDRAKEGEVLAIDGGREHVQRLVDLLPGCEARRRAWKGGGGGGEEVVQ
jgi:hypothetical protein